MEFRPDPVSYQIMYNPVTMRYHIICYGIGDIVQMFSGAGLRNSLKETLPCHLDQFLRLWADLSHAVSPGCVRMISLINQPRIQAHNISLTQNTVCPGNPVHNLLIYGDTDACRISLIVQEVWCTAISPDQFLTDRINLLR